MTFCKPVLIGATLGLLATLPAAAPAAAQAASAPTSKSAVSPTPSKAPDTAPSPAARSSPDGAQGRESLGIDDATASRNAARSRMHECGHQWSTMKKNGTASGTTWKDFSQGCLARK